MGARTYKSQDVTLLHNKDKANIILKQLINTPGLMDEFNLQLRKYKLNEIKQTIK
jgi:Zn-finger protein